MFSVLTLYIILFYFFVHKLLTTYNFFYLNYHALYVTNIKFRVTGQPPVSFFIYLCNGAILKVRCVITAHFWYDGHSTSISTCGVWGVRVKFQVSKRKFHIHIYLDYENFFSVVSSWSLTFFEKKKNIYIYIYIFLYTR